MLMKYIPEVVSPVVPSSPSTWSLSPPGVAGLLCPSLPIVCIIYEHTECVCVWGGGGACTSYQDHQCVDQSQLKSQYQNFLVQLEVRRQLWYPKQHPTHHKRDKCDGSHQ